MSRYDAVTGKWIAEFYNPPEFRQEEEIDVDSGPVFPDRETAEEAERFAYKVITNEWNR